MTAFLFSTHVMKIAGIVVSSLVVAAFVAYVVRTWLRDRPTRRTSAYDRLLVRNPMLNADRDVRWTVASRRVRFGWLTTTLVAVALLVASSRPTTVPPSSDDR